jgi:hypothetical protein
MKRRIFKTLSAISLAVGLATCVAWARSYRSREAFAIERFGLYCLSCDRGEVWFEIDTQESDFQEGNRVRVEHGAYSVDWRIDATPLPLGPLTKLLSGRMAPFGSGRALEWGDAWGWHSTDVAYCVLPCWFIVALTAAALVLGAVARYRKRVRPAFACFRCGYDLRATPDRCPECGTVAEKYVTIRPE